MKVSLGNYQKIELLKCRMNLLSYFLLIFLCLLLITFLMNLHILWSIYYQKTYSEAVKSKPKPLKPAKESQTLKEFEKKLLSLIDQAFSSNAKIKGYLHPEILKLKNGPHYKKKVLSAEEIVCDIKKEVSLQYFLKNDSYFSLQGVGQHFLSEPPLYGKTFDKCAIISSSGYLKNSGLGTLINSHDQVIRFNNAPTAGYESDVGSKTTLRIVNSKVLMDSSLKFEEPNSIFSKSDLIVWESTDYNRSTEEWYHDSESGFFRPFFAKRLMNPSQGIYLIKPSSLWSVWIWLQSKMKKPIPTTPTTSGFLGLMLTLKQCHIVKLFGFIPTVRNTDVCYYYETKKKANALKACTLDGWHPRAAEKSLLLTLNNGTKKETFERGYVTIYGLPSLTC